jgi:uncharacterized protein (DUF1015 family)
MAEIAPIRGILYDPSKVELSKVIAPPYDVISEDDRTQLEALDPHNAVRLILPRGDGDARYQAAAGLLSAWRETGILTRDARPAIYRYHQVFQHAELGDRKVTRRGFICAVRLHSYDEGIIRPHERTLRGPKEDRLKLMRAARAHFSQIFGMFHDPSRTADDFFDRLDRKAPDLEGTTPDGTLHRLWRLTDRETMGALAKVIAPLPIYIADGHHRYETMLALRNEYRAAAKGGYLPPHASPEFATFFLCNMTDPGLIILPTHRLIHSLGELDSARFFEKAARYFATEILENGARDANALKLKLAELSKIHPTFAVILPGAPDARLLSVRNIEAVIEELPPPQSSKGARALLSLDVTLLHHVVIEKLLGIDREAQEKQTNITYVKDTRDALARMQKGEAQLGFIMHPTRGDQVLQVADAHETMPQKSTFFYPKIASGLVVNPIDPDEDLDRIMG